MAIFRLTMKTIQSAIKQTQDLDCRVVLRDGGGLELILSSKNKGQGSWILRTTDYYGKRRTLKIGSFCYFHPSAGLSLDKARELALRMKARIKDNQVSVQSKVKIDELFNSFINSKERAKNTIKSYKASYNFLLNLNFDQYPIEKIDLSLAASLLEKKEGMYQTKRHAILIFNMLREYGAKMGLLKQCQKIDFSLIEAPVKSKARKSPSLEELDSFFKENLTVENVKEAHSLLSVLALSLTLCRGREIVNSDFNNLISEGDRKFLYIPAERMKCKKDHILPIGDFTFEVLSLFFKAQANPELGKSYKHLFETAKKLNFNFDFHGLRATGATEINKTFIKNNPDIKISDIGNIVGLCLSHAHKQNYVESRYNRYDYYEEKEEVMKYWEKTLLTKTNLKKLFLRIKTII